MEDQVSLDLKNLVAQETAEFEVQHPVSKKPTGMFITISGPGAEAYQMARFEAAKKRLDGADKELSAEAIRDTAREVLAAAVTSWRGLEFDGAEFAYSPANVKYILETPGLYWLRDQIDAAVSKVENFIKA